MTPAGFPHSEILGSKLVSSSPRLIAADHVFHRLLAPRHSPFALINLDQNRLDAISEATTSVQCHQSTPPEWTSHSDGTERCDRVLLGATRGSNPRDFDSASLAKQENDSVVTEPKAQP